MGSLSSCYVVLQNAEHSWLMKVFFPLGESFYSPVFGVLMKINGESLELMITLYLPFLTDEEIREI